MVQVYRNEIQKNIDSYKSSFPSPNHRVGFSMKANHNPVILQMMKDNGLDAVTVSGSEILLALKTGFLGSQIFYNGVGKQRWEIELAVTNSCFLNVDSIFDAELISQVAREKEKVTQVCKKNSETVQMSKISF